MSYVIVFLISIGVGAGAYTATMRAGRRGPAAVGFEAARRADDPSTHEVSLQSLTDATEEGDVGTEEVVEEEPGTIGPAATGYTYLRISTQGPSWLERVQGLVALVVLVTISAAALAFVVYQLGRIVNETIARFLGN